MNTGSSNATKSACYLLPLSSTHYCIKVYACNLCFLAHAAGVASIADASRDALQFSSRLVVFDLHSNSSSSLSSRSTIEKTKRSPREQLANQLDVDRFHLPGTGIPFIGRTGLRTAPLLSGANFFCRKAVPRLYANKSCHYL